MIKEICDPLETIFEHLAKKRASKKIKKEFNTNISEFDVFFKEDTSLIREFSKRCNIDYELAEKIAIIFFEEIKKVMLNGGVARIRAFGVFYINGPHFDRFHNVVLPKDKYTKFLPSFKAFPKFKKLNNDTNNKV